MENNIHYLVLEKLLLNYDNSIVIFSILNILNHIYNDKIPINQNEVIKEINKLITLFPKISIDEWVKYFIRFLKYHIDNKQWNVMTKIIADYDKNKKNIIFNNNYIIIKYHNNNIEFIYKDKNLIEGTKYLYKNHIMNHSLQYRVNQLKDKLIEEIIQK